MTNVRIAAVADLHFSKSSRGEFHALVAALGSEADVLLVCGDLTHLGHVSEAATLAEELALLRIPMLAVLGNHDYHSGEQEQIKSLLSDAGVHILDGESIEIHGIGFAGVKGFAGGFGRRVLEPWGEEIVKRFVHESVDEALKLETALARLKVMHRIVLLHYSPIFGTVEGEPPEIFPFLGSSRLEEPINRFQVTAVFHGHAHHGRLEGRTSVGIPVYNVSLPLMRGLSPDRPFRIFEIPSGDSVEGSSTPLEP